MDNLSTQVLIIGGGVTGLGIAWDACLRGLKVVLVEQGDLAQGTSGRFHGLLHSGGRYALSDPETALACARENLILRRILPHAIEDTGGFFLTSPTDPPEYADRWHDACLEAGVPVEEIETHGALRREPNLNPRIQRAFYVNDAALDSFDLLHALKASVEAAGGQVWLRHRVEQLILKADAVIGASGRSTISGEPFTIGADVTVNAAGPWTGSLARFVGVELPLMFGKGTMIAMTSRLVNTVINRCRPPSDGDIIVPVGTVAVLGTTDVQVGSPEELEITADEIDILMAEGEILIPSLRAYRPLRAWSGIRAHLLSNHSSPNAAREAPRGQAVIQHADQGGPANLITALGGKLTTFRLIAEQTVDAITEQLKEDARCRTAEVPIPPPPGSSRPTTNRWAALEANCTHETPPQVICECELVTRAQMDSALRRQTITELDDLRRDLRLGMGPCQAGICAYRAAGYAYEVMPDPPDGLLSFLNERWGGLRPIAWGPTLRQMEFNRRIACETLGVGHQPEEEPA